MSNEDSNSVKMEDNLSEEERREKRRMRILMASKKRTEFIKGRVETPNLTENDKPSIGSTLIDRKNMNAATHPIFSL